MKLEARLGQPVTSHVRPAATLDSTDTIGASLRRLRAGDPAQGILYFYAVDEAGRLVGVVPTRRLLVSSFRQRVGEIMVPNVVSVPHTASVREAAEVMRRYRFMAMPVVDDAGALLGVIDMTVLGEDIEDEVQNIESDAFQLFGLRLDLASSPSPLRAFGGRFPWLLANIAGGILCALVISAYEPLLKAALVLTLFIPVVLTLSESVSIQSMTLTLQSIHQTEPNLDILRRAFLRELLTAILLGLGCGVLVALLAMFWHHSLPVALALISTLTLSMLTACVTGFLLPHAIHKLRGDPTIAAGPLVLVTTDVCALLFYLNLAGLYLERSAN